MTTYLLGVGLIFVAMIIMAIGVLFGRPPIKGSCGGIAQGDCACSKPCAGRQKTGKQP